MAFRKIYALIDRMESLTIDSIMDEVWDDRYLKALVLDLNFQSQLYEKGVDAAGNLLGYYSPFTVRYKRSIAGSIGNDTRSDHITLKDTGEFYNSGRVEKVPGGIVIDAETNKGGGDDLAVEFGKKILGLSNESIQELIPEVRERVIPLVRQKVIG